VELAIQPQGHGSLWKDRLRAGAEQQSAPVRSDNSKEIESQVSAMAAPSNDPLSYLAAVVRGDIRPAGLSSLEVNVIATEILDAARESARTGQRVQLRQ
jgi:predicted dehydrogenase